MVVGHEVSQEVVLPHNYSQSVSPRFSNLSRDTGDGGSVVVDVSEVTKRSLALDEFWERALKRSRKVDNCNHTLSHDEIPVKHYISDVGNGILGYPQKGEGPFFAATTEHLRDANNENNKKSGDSGDLRDACCGISSMSSDRHMHGSDEGPERCVLPFSPGVIEDDHPSNDLVLPEGLCLSILDCFPRKQVALGPDHQADVPVWNPGGLRNACDQNVEKVGVCVVPMPDADTQVPLGPRIGADITCGCPDQGSVRCVRLHVAEAREKFLKVLGPEKFAELGFCDMGEDVALKWTEEEEHMFHQVVFANPASLGKNFWNILPLVFPNKSCKELVSYYFNVFMLRKRSQQNRSVPMNIDSDDDEWQARDNVGFAMEDYEEDSVVESPMYHGGIYENGDHEERDENLLVRDEEEDASDDYGFPNDINEHGSGDASNACANYNSVSVLDAKCPDNSSQGLEHDFQDDSCTSYEGQNGGGDCHGSRDSLVTGHSTVETVHKRFAGEYKNDGSSQYHDAEFNGGHCDTKPWDSYFSRSPRVADFLPTCNVIEEVFGNGTWDNGARDGQGTI